MERAHDIIYLVKTNIHTYITGLKYVYHFGQGAGPSTHWTHGVRIFPNWSITTKIKGSICECILNRFKKSLQFSFNHHQTVIILITNLEVKRPYRQKKSGGRTECWIYPFIHLFFLSSPKSALISHNSGFSQARPYYLSCILWWYDMNDNLCTWQSIKPNRSGDRSNAYIRTKWLHYRCTIALKSDTHWKRVSTLPLVCRVLHAFFDLSIVFLVA